MDFLSPLRLLYIHQPHREQIHAKTNPDMANAIVYPVSRASSSLSSSEDSRSLSEFTFGVASSLGSLDLLSL